LAMNNYQYRVVMSGTCTPANTASAAAILTVNTAAVITANPVDGNRCLGTSISFTSAASGSSPSYQWQVSTDGGFNYTNLSSATSATLTLNNVSMALNGNRYRCVATVLSCGSVASTPAILTVYALPVVTASINPIDQVKPGTSTLITAGSVPGPVSYVWRFNNNVIPGATTRSITADVTGLGKYNVTVTDINGCSNTSADVEVKALMSDRLFIYPNPNSGQFTVRLYSYWNFGTKVVIITNSAGMLVEKKIFISNSNYFPMQFDLRGQATGIYMVHVYDKFTKTEAVGKVFIQR
jgi:Secretion system C-terminal sorting domain/PKD-like domain